MRIALSIAGSDPSGGAGIQGDLKTFHRFGVYGTAVIALVTAQNTLGVSRVEVLDAELVAQQLDAVLSDLPPHAVKTGALGSAGNIRAVARAAREYGFPLVVDPVAAASDGSAFLNAEALAALREELLPLATLITPNLQEAAALTGLEVRDADGMHRAAEALGRLGARAVLLKGGHLQGAMSTDLFYADGQFVELPAARIETRHTHGTGCALSAAITAGLAHGQTLPEAIAAAKAFVTRAIESNPGLGAGAGPLNFWA